MDDKTLLMLLLFLAFLFLSNNGNLGRSICGNLVEGSTEYDRCHVEVANPHNPNEKSMVTNDRLAVGMDSIRGNPDRYVLALNNLSNKSGARCQDGVECTPYKDGSLNCPNSDIDYTTTFNEYVISLGPKFKENGISVDCPGGYNFTLDNH